MTLRPIVIGVLLLAGSTCSFAASTLIANQFVAPSNLIGGALPEMKRDTFTAQTGYPSSYSASLDYSTGPIIDTSGNSVAPGHASTSISFNLPRGEFKLFSESLLPSQGPTVGGLSSRSGIILYDYLTIHSPTASSTNPTFLTLHLEADGEMSLLRPQELQGNNSFFSTVLTARNETQRSFSSGHITSSCTSFAGTSDCSSAQGAGFNGGAFATVDPDLKDGGQDEITLRIPLYQETSVVQFEVELTAGSTQAVTDFSNTAKLFIDVPGGTYTSESGIMSAIPEPETYAMFLAGLGLMGFVRRRTVRIV